MTVFGEFGPLPLPALNGGYWATPPFVILWRSGSEGPLRTLINSSKCVQHEAVRLMKPKLVPAQVPWSVSAHVACLELHLSKDGDLPLFASFVAYFEMQDQPKPAFREARSYEDPGPFRPAGHGEEGQAYHVVGVRFLGGVRGRLIDGHSDDLVLDDEAYDWSALPVDLLEGETIDQNLARCSRYCRETGLSPDPRFYEVIGSPWLAEVEPKRRDLQHYIILGTAEYVEVIAEAWEWELGQPLELRPF